MTAPTGNRWVNQDTGDIANPDNIQTDLPGHGQKVKYGPLVTGVWPPGQEPSTPPTPPSSSATAGMVESHSAADAGEPLEAGEIGEPIAVPGEHEVTGDEPPELEGRKLAAEPSATDPKIAQEQAALERTKLSIRELNRVSTSPKSTKPEKKAADAGLKQLTALEYGRPDGGREPIKRILARYGYGNPNKGR